MLPSILSLTTPEELRQCAGFPTEGRTPPNGPTDWRHTSAVIRACPGTGDRECGQLVPANRTSEYCADCENERRAARPETGEPEQTYLCPGPEIWPDLETCGRLMPTPERCEECTGRREWLRKEAAAQKRRDAAAGTKATAANAAPPRESAADV